MPAFPSDQRPPSERAVLGFDTGSPLVSVALVAGDRMLAERDLAQRDAGRDLIPAAREVLSEAGLVLDELGALAVLRGPGSFTGLRIGLATVLGLHQATGLPTAALSSHHALAAAAIDAAGIQAGADLIAAVDALRGEWSVRRYAAGHPPRPLGDAELMAETALERAADPVVGFGLGRLGGTAPRAAIDPGPLAVWAARLAGRLEQAWDPALLERPLYARPPAVTPPAIDADRDPGAR